MFKKKIALFFIVLICGVGIYFSLARKTNEKVEEIDSDLKVVTSESGAPKSLKVNTDESAPKPHMQEKINKDDQFAAFDKLEKEWLGKVHEVIGDEHFVRYSELRADNEKAKLDAYKEYHNYLRQKYGDKFKYNISDDQSVREEKINQYYLKSLLKLIGPEKFKDYIKSKDQFNEKMRRENETSIQIEF